MSWVSCLPLERKTLSSCCARGKRLPSFFRIGCFVVSALLTYIIFDKNFLSKNVETSIVDSEPTTTQPPIFINQSEQETKKAEDFPIPLDINQPLLITSSCVTNLDEVLKKVRSYQKEASDNWYKLPMTDEVKWATITNTYNPDLVSFQVLYHIVVSDETKYMADFNIRAEPNCNVYSIGIGFDYSDGINVWQRYPQCQMTGVDPTSYINKNLVERIPGARFFEATIGAQDGNHTALLRLDDSQYHRVAVNHTGIANFFQQVNGQKLIDLLIMDVEGAEFGILPALIDEKDRLPIICQFNVEIHPPQYVNYTLAEGLAAVHKLLSDGTYAVFNMDVFRRFVRLFMINIENPECRKKFFCQK